MCVTISLHINCHIILVFLDVNLIKFVLFSRDNWHYSVTIIWYQNDTDLFSCSMEY